jgi:UDP-N-acetylmuramyl pentapeptide phosphotransferase/UDP-N-acetylglucosamine-1-phosphate transferase
MGATIACAVILEDMKTIGALLFIPMIIEFFLKLRGHFKSENYGTPDIDGYLTYEKRIESITHLIMKGRRIKEKQLVWIIWAVEGVLCLIVLISVFFGLFG